MEFVVKADGTIVNLLEDEQPWLNAIGEVAAITRNSHVETRDSLSPEARAYLQKHCQVRIRPEMWWADMLPVGGPVLGPYPTKDAAIAAELEYMRENTKYANT